VADASSVSEVDGGAGGSGPFDAVAPNADATSDARAGDRDRRPLYAGTPDSHDENPALTHCLSEADCARVDLHCSLADASAGACVACVSNTDCLDPALPRCNPSLNRCVACDVGADCRQGEVCLAQPTYTCVPSCATAMLICPPRAAYCDPLRKVCLACTDSAQCGLGQTCDTVSGRCGECVADSDCRRNPLVRCDRTTSSCVECLTTNDCSEGVCSALGTCVGPGGAR
jgi:hypothetical protein